MPADIGSHFQSNRARSIPRYDNTMNYKIALITLAFCSVSCGKKSPGSSHYYPYLDEKMNEPASVSAADLAILLYSKSAAGKSNSWGSAKTKFGMLYEDSAWARLENQKIHLEVNIELSGGSEHEWLEQTTKDERENACNQVCFANIFALAKFLHCDPKLIEARWVCLGRIDGNTSGEEALAAKATEQSQGRQPTP